MPILYMMKMTQNINVSINLILQHGRVVEIIFRFISYFKISIFDPVCPIRQMEGSCHLLSYTD